MALLHIPLDRITEQNILDLIDARRLRPTSSNISVTPTGMPTKITRNF